MSKRATKFLILLALVTSGISVFFISCSFLIDQFTDSALLSDTFYYIRTAFDLVAEYTAFAIVIYAFCRYKFKQAWPSVIIALGSFLISAVFQIGATAAENIVSPILGDIIAGKIKLDFSNFANILETIKNIANSIKFDFYDILGNIGIDLLLGFFGLTIERLIPCVLIALITFLSTMHGTSRISKAVSFKNPSQRAMMISCLLLYLINAVPQLILTVIDFIGYGGPSNMYAEDFFAFIAFELILQQASILIYNLVLQYLVYLLIYYLCQKHEENAPIKKQSAVILNGTATEEK